MVNPVPPYYVSFSADPASSARIDHSQAAPGGVAHRAGHTSVSLRGRGGLTWQPETGAPGTDGRVPFWFASVNVFFRLTDYVILISSDYAAGSCAYNATLRHEVDEHIVNPARILFRYRDRVVTTLNAVRLPTANAPRWLRPDQVDVIEEDYLRQVRRVIEAWRPRILAEMQQAQARSDSPDSYLTVYRQCTPQQWGTP
jgi:hypothetical protein